MSLLSSVIKHKYQTRYVLFITNKDGNISNSLVQLVRMVIIKHLIGFIIYKNIFINLFFHHNFVNMTKTKLSLLSTCTHFRKPASYKSNNDFCLSNYIDLHNTSAKPGFFFLHEGEDKMIFRWNNVTLISLKHSCLIQFEGLKVRTFHIFILNANK